MREIRCHLLCHSNNSHLQQLYAGFFMLARSGRIKLSQSIERVPETAPTQPRHPQNARHAHLRVIVNDSLRLHYDTHDSWEVDLGFLRAADHYFKRSYGPQRQQSGVGSDLGKIAPLGLYYHVYANRGDRFALQRIVQLEGGGTKRMAALARTLGGWTRTIFVPTVGLLEQAVPERDRDPKILFMVRAWDPHDDADRALEKVSERERLNEVRASCIEQLRAEFGERFYGGFTHRPYAVERYRSLLVPDQKLCARRRYLELMKSYAVCVHTTGLHGSIGGKMGEYVAAARAILTEKLNYEVPGQFESGSNFLEFSTPEECLEQAERLMVDRALRMRMMQNNSRYYRLYVRPDALVLNTLLYALEK